MIEKSVFTNESIKSIVKKEYNIEVDSAVKLNRGSANIYLLNNEYILKEFQSKYTEEEALKEINVINHLRKDNIPVPEYISTINDKYCFSYKDRTVIMQKYVDGYTKDMNGATYDQMIESAAYLGKIVASLQTLDIDLPNNNVSSWFKADKIQKSIDKHKELYDKAIGKYKDKIQKDMLDKIEMLESMKTKNFNNLDKITYMKTHGDYNVLQFIYEKEKIKCIIDFAAASIMPIVWEVIRSFSYIDSKSKDGNLDINNLKDYVKEFMKYVPLNEYDLEYMPYLYLIQTLNSDYGYKQYIEDNTKEELLEFGLDRTNLCRFLYENANNISLILKK